MGAVVLGVKEEKIYKFAWLQWSNVKDKRNKTIF